MNKQEIVSMIDVTPQELDSFIAVTMAEMGLTTEMALKKFVFQHRQTKPMTVDQCQDLLNSLRMEVLKMYVTVSDKAGRQTRDDFNGLLGT